MTENIGTLFREEEDAIRLRVLTKASRTASDLVLLSMYTRIDLLTRDFPVHNLEEDI